MVVDFSKVDVREKPILILKNATDTPIGVLGAASAVAADIKYNEVSTLEFNFPAYVDGEKSDKYDSVVGMKIVDLQNIGQFVLMNPKEIGDGIKQYKACKGYSLEYEFTFKKITLQNGTYEFWNPSAPDSSVLGMILSLMPSWSIGSISNSLVGKYRTFEVSDTNLYDFIKNTLQKSYNCIFDFDTYNRKINVRDVSSAVATKPIYISFENLAKEIEVEEDTESIVTRLDVNGAEGVDIRDVNPTGNNKIINLDYYMTIDNFSQSIINKYNNWKTVYKNNQLPYYNLSIEYSMQTVRKATESAAMTELQGELTSLENQQAVIIRAIAQNLENQDALDAINAQITAKQAEITAKQAEIDGITATLQATLAEMAEINETTDFQSYFTANEYKQIDRYIKDDSVSESSFVVQYAQSYSDDFGCDLAGKTIVVEDTTVTSTSSTSKTIYSLKGGTLTIDGVVSANIISSILEHNSDNTFVMSFYLSKGTVGESDFETACLSITGSCTVTSTATSLSVALTSAYMYLTLNTSEYAKRAVAWDLYEYGNGILEKISQPSYKFSITSANFIYLEDFEEFKTTIRHGEKLYVGISEDKTLAPIAIGMKIDYDNPANLSLEFSDTYLSGDSAFQLADLLEQSISMGKSVDLSKYTYSAFVDSGASTRVKDFMNSALDVAKNAILSSKDQAISWDEAGIRLRKWADEARTRYEPKQVWMNNNSILMTSDNWSTAEIAIGNFYDDNLGDCWGIVAPNIVGTLLAGSNLVIESEKESGGVAVFKVDADGCVLHNSDFSITSDATNTHILLDPEHGIIVGAYPLIDDEGNIDEEKYKFWVDGEGNLFFKGTLKATTGEFTGKVTAKEGYIGGEEGWTIASTYIYNGKPSYTSGNEGIYIGTDGIALGDAENYVKLGKNGTLAANNANITGTVTANLLYANSGGTIGGFTINPTYLANKKDAYNDTEEGVYIGTDGIGLGEGKFWVSADGYLHAATGEFTGDIKGGTININNNFKVDSDGNVTMTKGSININGKFVVTNDGNTVVNGGSININDNFVVDSDGNVQLNGNITWGAGSSPTQSVFARTALTKPADGTKYSSFASSSSTAWHKTFDTTNDQFASYTYDGGATWTDAIKVVGTDGINGQDGADGADGRDGVDGTNGSDASVTDENVFRAITSNYTMYGCFTASGNKLYINASRINSGVLTVSDGTYTLFKADVTNKTVQIAAFSVSGDSIIGTNVGMCGKSGENWAFWAGDNSSGDAPFRVGHAGELYATNATLSGTFSNLGTGLGVEITGSTISFYTGSTKIGHLQGNTTSVSWGYDYGETKNSIVCSGLFCANGGIRASGLQLSSGYGTYVDGKLALTMGQIKVQTTTMNSRYLLFYNGLLVGISADSISGYYDYSEKTYTG